MQFILYLYEYGHSVRRKVKEIMHLFYTRAINDWITIDLRKTSQKSNLDMMSLTSYNYHTKILIIINITFSNNKAHSYLLCALKLISGKDILYSIILP